MTFRTGLVLAAVMWAGMSGAVGADRPLREAQSENGRFRLELRPAQAGVETARGCRAVLFEQPTEGRRGKKCWERYLVNETAPAVVCVRDDGRFVVTLDEFGLGGARHALVIYGPQGELLRHFTLRDLLQKADWKRVVVRERSIRWLEKAKYEFVAEPPEFVVTLEQGRRIRVDLHALRVTSPEGVRVASGDDDIPGDVLAVLQTGLTEAAADEVKGPEAGSSPAADRDVAAMAKAIADPNAGPDGEAAPQVVHDAPGAGPEETRVAPSVIPSIAPPVTATQPAPRVAHELPRPDPAHPADYVAWANDLVRTEGPNAGPQFEAAAAKMVDWTGDDETLRAAQRGDAAALGSVAVQEWLDANQEAVSLFRDAGRLEFRGWPLHSKDGSLAGAELPNLAVLRLLARITITDGKRLEAEGFAAGALDNYVDTLVAGERISRGPTLIENLVGVAMQNVAASAVLDLSAGPEAQQVDYAALARRLEASSRPTRPLGEALELEQAMFLDTLQRAYTVDVRTGEYVLSEPAENSPARLSAADDLRGKLPARLSKAAFEQAVRDGDAAYAALREAVALPYPQAQRRLKALEAERANRAEVNPLVKALGPSLTRAHQVAARGEVVRRAATLTANIMAYRQQHGAYPESLDALAGQDCKVDPLTGRSFGYRRVGADFVLYSRGDNGTNEGRVDDPRGETNDLVFWPRPTEP